MKDLYFFGDHSGRLSSTTDTISHFGTSLTGWGGGTDRCVGGGLMFEFSVNLGADQDDYRGDPDPGHEANRGAE